MNVRNLLYQIKEHYCFENVVIFDTKTLIQKEYNKNNIISDYQKNKIVSAYLYSLDKSIIWIYCKKKLPTPSR